MTVAHINKILLTYSGKVWGECFNSKQRNLSSEKKKILLQVKKFGASTRRKQWHWSTSENVSQGHTSELVLENCVQHVISSLQSKKKKKSGEYCNDLMALVW